MVGCRSIVIRAFKLPDVCSLGYRTTTSLDDGHCEAIWSLKYTLIRGLYWHIMIPTIMHKLPTNLPNHISQGCVTLYKSMLILNIIIICDGHFHVSMIWVRVNKGYIWLIYYSNPYAALHMKHILIFFSKSLLIDACTTVAVHFCSTLWSSFDACVVVYIQLVSNQGFVVWISSFSPPKFASSWSSW